MDSYVDEQYAQQLAASAPVKRQIVIINEYGSYFYEWRQIIC